MSKTQIVVVESGWVFIGQVTLDKDFVRIDNAQNIRTWGTTAGLGQLALQGRQSGTVLDAYGVVTVPRSALLALIDCAEGVW